MVQDLTILDDDSNQYLISDRNYGIGTLETCCDDIRPGVTVDGFILVEPIPKTIPKATLIFELGRDQNYNDYTFQYNLYLIN